VKASLYKDKKAVCRLPEKQREDKHEPERRKQCIALKMELQRQPALFPGVIPSNARKIPDAAMPRSPAPGFEGQNGKNP
jgi:hypothetical protein